MTKNHPAAAKTCFRLRHAPMGFDSAIPWRPLEQEFPIEPGEPPTAEAKPRRRRGFGWAALGLVVLLTTYFVSAWTASFTKGVSFDEGLQLAVGYNIWRTDDFRREGANGDFIKRWATLPYLVSQPAFLSQSDPRWLSASGYELGSRFLFELGNQPESLLRQGRAMVALLGVATGLIIFLSARELFGSAGGLVALALFAFNPSMLAFGGIVSTDLSVTFPLFGATWMLWRLLHHVSWPRLALSSMFVALVVLTKMSGLVIIPIAAALVVVRMAVGRPLTLRWRRRERNVTRRSHMLATFCVLALMHALIAWSAIWAHYGFRYDARPHPEMAPTLPPPKFDDVPVFLQTALTTIRERQVLPEVFSMGSSCCSATTTSLARSCAGSGESVGGSNFSRTPSG